MIDWYTSSILMQNICELRRETIELSPLNTYAGQAIGNRLQTIVYFLNFHRKFYGQPGSQRQILKI